MERTGGRRAHRSIRFRLTAWHALALAAALALFGAGISTVLAYDLRRDLDDRLAADALQVYLQVEQARDLREATRYLDLFALTGAATEIRDAGGGVVYASDTLGGRELAVAFLQLRFEVEQLELAGRAGLEHVDHALGLRGIMRLTRS